MQHVNWNAVPSKEPQPGVTTRRFDSQLMTIVRYDFQPGAIFPLHSHPEEQVVLVTSGYLTFTVGDRQVEMRAGDICHVNPHVPHGAVAGSDGASFFNLLAPRRVTDQVQFHA